MCETPITHYLEQGAVQFACRTCNDCIAARKNDWVARAMAEKETSGCVMAVELTYRNDPDGEAPDSAKAFKYGDVAAFLKRLREWYYRKYNARGEISFIVAGERGSKRGRVHWHLLIFSKRPLQPLGKWYDFLWKLLPGPLISRMGKKAKMIHWDAWPHGHVVVKEPTQEGVAYVLKYALKDQFNVVKSKGTARFAKAENHGASYFRMSKAPPIGFRWLEKRCDEWEARLVVPAKLELSVPDYKGFWWPKGKLREYLLARLHIINEKRREKYGKDCPTWMTLLASIGSENVKDWEMLAYGPEITEQKEEFDAWQWQAELGHPDAAIRRRCGGTKVCALCWRGFGTQEKADFRAWYEAQARGYVTDTQSPPGYDFEKWYRQGRKINPFCVLGECEDRKAAFGSPQDGAGSC